jgi:hypothetical protein
MSKLLIGACRHYTTFEEVINDAVCNDAGVSLVSASPLLRTPLSNHALVAANVYNS